MIWGKMLQKSTWGAGCLSQVFFFFVGVILSLVCGLRINVRVLRAMGAWQRKRRPDPLSDWMTSFLEEIKLRDTVGLEDSWARSGYFDDDGCHLVLKPRLARRRPEGGKAAEAMAVRQRVVADGLTDLDVWTASSVPADEPLMQFHGRCGRARRQLREANARACRSRDAARALRDPSMGGCGPSGAHTAHAFPGGS